jgi:DNA-binding transcriptional regulator YiaG
LTAVFSEAQSIEHVLSSIHKKVHEMKTKKQNIDGFYQKLDEILKQATKRLKTVQEIPVKILLSEDNTAKLLGFSKQTLARWRIIGGL